MAVLVRYDGLIRPLADSPMFKRYTEIFECQRLAAVPGEQFNEPHGLVNF